LVQLSIVLHGSEFSVFLLDEEKWCGIRALGGANIFLLCMFYDKFLQLVLFLGSEGVYFSREYRGSVGL